MKKLKASIILLMMAVMAVAGSAYAAPVLLGSITDGIEEPARVALDVQGNIYVAEPAEGRVNKFNSKGEKVGSVKVVRPYGVAVGADGSLYVCSMQVRSKKNGYVNKSAVQVFSPSLVMTGTIGGAGEFSGPVDIAIDGSGALYVADIKQGVVKVFDANGEYLHSIGGGHLRSDWTQGVAVNDGANGGAGEVYVTDTVKATVQGYTVDVPRISVFTKNGAFLRSFGQFGSEAGKMKKLSGIALDRNGRLLVADTGNNVVHILDAGDGSPVGEGGLYANNAYRPGGVAVSKGNVAVVAWESGRVDSFGLDGFVTLSVSPDSLQFEARQYSGNPAAQTVAVSNEGTGTLNWTAQADQDWISLGQQAAAGPGASVDLAVGVDAANLTSGSYSGTVTVTSDSGQQAAVAVGLTVAQPLMLNISNWSPSFSLKRGDTSDSTTVTISIDGGAGSWSIDPQSLPSWLNISPLAGGAAETAVTFTASAAGMAAQAAPYVATVPVAAPGVIGDGSAFTVSMTVNATTRISVGTNNDGATFVVAGKTATYDGSGSSWSVEDAPAGDYTVTFGAVSGFKKPAPETKTLADDGAVAFNGVYESYKDLAAKKNIVVARGPGKADNSRVKAYKNDGEQAAFDLVAFETRGGASVATGDIDGDGVDDLIVGAGAGKNNPAVVRVYRTYDKAMMAEFVPFGTLNGAGVAAADLNGDGRAEIIVSDNNGAIAVYTVVDGRMTNTGVELKGSAAAAADTAGDGRPEIVTIADRALHVWKIDTAAAVGGWTAAAAGDLAVAATSVAAADTDGDGADEIIAGVNGKANEPSSVVILETNGGKTAFPAFDKSGISLAAADMDGDGKAEVLAGAGAKRKGNEHGKNDDDERDGHRKGTRDREEGTVRVYSANGDLQFVINAFDDAESGVNLSVGDLGL